MVDQIRLAARAREDFVGFTLISCFAYAAAFVKAFLFDQYDLSVFSDWSVQRTSFLERLVDNFSFLGLILLPIYGAVSGAVFGFLVSYNLVKLIERPEPHVFESFGAKEAKQIRIIRVAIFLCVFLLSVLLTFLIPYSIFHLFFLE